MTAGNETSRPIDPEVRIGHVHLKVADLERSLQFYCGVLGFELTQRYGTQAAFVSAGGYHHHIGLNTWESLGGSPPPPGTTGLYHVAILYPTRRALSDALQRLVVAGMAAHHIRRRQHHALVVRPAALGFAEGAHGVADAARQDLFQPLVVAPLIHQGGAAQDAVDCARGGPQR